MSLDLAPFLPKIAEICRRRQVASLDLFGSALRDDFGPDSDVDVLLRFRPDATDRFLNYFGLKTDLEGLFGRSVDLIEDEAVRNPCLRTSINGNRRGIYAA